MAFKTSLLRFKFDDFENLASEPGDFVNPSEMKDCYGGEWLLTLYPGGKETSTDNHEERAMELRVIFNKRMKNKTQEVKVSMWLTIPRCKLTLALIFAVVSGTMMSSLGSNILVDRALVIDTKVQFN